MGRIWHAGRGRWWRPVYLVAGLYLTVSLAVNAVILLAVVGAKLFAGDPLSHDSALPRIHNFRQADDRLWVGGQAGQDDYRQLVTAGVTVIVDLRTGAPGDARDDPGFLNEIGLDYVWLPVRDGHAPDPATVNRFLDVVRGAEGIVYMHCGGGVGRSYSLQAAYEAAMGRDPSVAHLFALGPPTVEQAWFVLAAEPAGPAAGDNRLVEIVSRFVFDGPRTAINWMIPQVF